MISITERVEKEGTRPANRERKRPENIEPLANIEEPANVKRMADIERLADIEELVITHSKYQY